MYQWPLHPFLELPGPQLSPPSRAAGSLGVATEEAEIVQRALASRVKPRGGLSLESRFLELEEARVPFLHKPRRLLPEA